jgi:class 3 adenylate cyclase/tetratricopeptide (TPR) repeat protein
MEGSRRTQVEQLRAAIAGLEAQRAALGDAVVRPALAALQQQLAALEQPATGSDGPPLGLVGSEAAHPADSLARPGQAVGAGGGKGNDLSGLPTSAERRVLTILFADVVGSTGIGERLDPEDVTEIMNGAFGLVNGVIARHDGTVARLMGDAVLAYFGAPRAHEDDPERAVRCGLEIQAEMRDYSGRVGRKYGVVFQIRVGIHTGLALLSMVGDHHRAELTAMGDTTNVASRLQASAPPGGVLISEDTCRYVRGLFEMEPQAPLRLRGKAEPLHGYLVTRARARPFRVVTRGVEGVETRTVGREVELDRLYSAYMRAVGERSTVWVQLAGDAGVGKSRLLADVSEWLNLRPETICTLKARAFEADAGQAFALIRRMWFDLFQIAEDAPLTHAESRWVEQFQRWGKTGEIEPAHALGLLVGLPFHDSPYIGAMRGDPVAVKGRALVVSRELVRSIRSQGSLVVLVEDLQWADAASWEYVAEVFLREEREDGYAYGLFLLTTARPEWDPLGRWPGSRAVVKPELITVSALPPSAIRELARALLRRVEEMPRSLVDLIVERSEGVPYFAEELVNFFLDRGVIDASGEPWRFVPERLQTTPLPATLQYLLSTRLISLPEEQRRSLQRGAVLGRHFWEGGLMALGVAEPRDALRLLQPRGFVDGEAGSSFEGETEWVFHHALLHEVAYESVLKRERSALHRAAAIWLEAQARVAGRLDEFAALLAQHAERAGETVEATDWYLRAAEHAKTQGAPAEARRLFDRAVELAPPGDPQRRWRAHLGRSETLGILGESEARRAEDSMLVALAWEMGDDERLAEAYCRRGFALAQTGDDRAALDIYDEALGLARRAGVLRLQALAMGLKVLSLSHLNASEDAAKTAEAALACAEALGDEATLVRVLTNVSVYYTESGDIARGVKMARHQAAITHRLGDRTGEMIALGNLGYGQLLLGLYDNGRTALEEALRLARANGARRAGAYWLLNLALAHLRCGDAGAAGRTLEQARGEFSSVGDRFGTAVGASYLGLVRESQGALPGAAQCYGEATEALTRMGMVGFANDARAGLARCALAQEELGAAGRHAVDLWSYLRTQGAGGMEFPGWAYSTCVEVFDTLGDLPNAGSAAEAGYAELVRRAERISEPEWRASYLENVPEHRALRAKWEQLQTNRR